MTGKKQKKKKTEFTSLSTARTARKSSLPGVRKTRRARVLIKRQLVKRTQENVKRKKAEAVKDKDTDTSKENVGSSSSSSKISPLIQKEEIYEKTTFIILQKNMRSMNSSERLELFSEVHQARWDVILISETWRQGKEVWETQQGHIVVESSPTSMESLSYLTKGVEIRSTGSNARANEWLQHRSQSKNNR